MKMRFNITPDVPNANGHIFPAEMLDKAFDEYMKNPNRFGTLGYNENLTEACPLSDVAFKVMSVTKDGDNRIGEIEIYNTPNGRRLKDAIFLQNEINKSVGIRADDIVIATVANGELTKKNVIKNFSIAYVTAVKESECKQIPITK